MGSEHLIEHIGAKKLSQSLFSFEDDPACPRWNEMEKNKQAHLLLPYNQCLMTQHPYVQLTQQPLEEEDNSMFFLPFKVCLFFCLLE